jgi:DNA invertase Pin-like site-specific DNA recombinase
MICLFEKLNKKTLKKAFFYSISNQKELLEDFSKKNGFVNVKIFADDGISGVTFQRNEFKKLIELIENYEIGILIVKDLSRLGRNYLEVGNLTENVLPMHNVRFISVNDGVDNRHCRFRCE